MSGSINQKSISSIPIKVIGIAPVSSRFHWKRRLVQVSAIFFAILIPASGLFRIDPEAGAFVILDRQIWLSDFFLIAGLWLTIVCGLVMLYSTAGTVFCGWACPQNTMAEWANSMMHRLLGKRAEVSLTGDAIQVAYRKNKIGNWLVLGAVFLLAAMFFGLIPLFYFYPPHLVWSFIIMQDDAGLAKSLHWIYTVSVLILFLDIAFIRHFWCRFSCIYRVWQHTFKTKQTLHVTYDAKRSDECAKCNYCVSSCFISLDPRKTDIYDSCINCGECIDACNRLHAKQGLPGLLKFEFGERKQARASRFRTAAVSLFSRANWVTPFALLGVAMLAWGVWSYQPYHAAIYHSEVQQGRSIQDYQISIANKLYRPAQFEVRVHGLPVGSYHFSKDRVKFSTTGRESITLSITKNLPHGLYSFVVDITSDDGWTGHYNMQHFSERG
jgi:polyferredoxin